MTVEDPDSRLAELLARWFDARYSGAEPKLVEICEDAPELADDLQRLIALQEGLSGFEGPEPSVGAAPLLQQLGSCRLRGRIGSGGMGDVYLAVQEPLGREVAVKVLRAEFAEDELWRLRFRREAEITAALDHPHIVPIYETGVERGQPYLVMRLLRGETLHRLAGTLASRDVARLGVQIARALHAAHEIGILHRDVKPANVIVEADHAYVLDFGLARAKVDLSLTAVGQVAGTLSYMAPEYVQRKSEPGDPRVDVYALGATLYHAVSGRAPFEHERPEVVLRHVLSREPEPLGLRGRDSDLEVIVLRAMDKEPGRRFSTAGDLAADLERFLEGLPIRSKPLGLPSRMLRVARRNPLNTASMAIASIALLALLAFVGIRARADRLERDRRLAGIEALLDEGRSSVALERLEELRPAWRDSPRAVESAAVARARLRRGALLDALQSEVRYGDLEYLRALRDLDSESPEVVAAEQESLLAEALLRLYTGELRSEDVAEFAAWRDSYPRTAGLIESHLRREALPEPHPTTSRGSPGAVDHVFASVVRGFAERPLAEIEAELRLAMSCDDLHPRTLFGLGTYHLLEGDPARASECFSGAAVGMSGSLEVAISQARVAFRRGDFLPASRHLERAEQLISAAGLPTPRRLDLTWLDLLLVTRDWSEHELRMRSLEAKQLDSTFIARIDLAAAQRLIRLEEYEQALVRLDAGLAAGPRSSVRRRLEIAALQTQVNLGVDTSTYSGIVERTDDLIADAESAADAVILADALWLRSALALAVGEVEFADRLTEQVFEAEPVHPDANLVVLGDLVEEVRSRGQTLEADELLCAKVGAALDRGERLLERDLRDVTHLDPEMRYEIAASIAWLAARVGRRELSVRAGRRACEHPIEGLPGVARLLEAAREALGIEVWIR